MNISRFEVRVLVQIDSSYLYVTLVRKVFNVIQLLRLQLLYLKNQTRLLEPNFYSNWLLELLLELPLHL
jgi:hypothetical protein